MSQKIPATVITGFLGAGKTSLIRNLLETANGKRIALIINEFGDLGVDGEIVKGCGIEGCAEDDVMELSNGCLCCTVADDFLPTIEKLLDRETPPDHIVVETSGLALPKPLVRAFGWPDVRTRVTVDGVVTVIDAAAVADGRFADDPDKIQAQRDNDESLSHENSLQELFEDQLHCADMVVLNKVDLISDQDLQMVRGEIEGQLKRAVKMVTASHGSIGADVLLGLDAGAEDDLDSRHSHHDHGHDHGHDDHHDDEDDHHDDDHHDHHHDHNHDQFESFIVEVAEIDNPKAFEKKLIDAVAAHDIFRIKGFVAVEGKPMRLVLQGVGSRFTQYFDRPWTETEGRQGKLVVIGSQGLDQAAIAALING